MIKADTELQPGNLFEPIPFNEAIEWFARQAPWITGDSWVEMTRLAALKGDQISGVTMLSALDDLWSKLMTAMQEGLPYSDFVESLGDEWGRKWWDVDSARMALIYRNNVGGALLTARHKMMTDPDILQARPYWMFDGIADFRQSDICNARDGFIAPADDPQWDVIGLPQLHHGCRSGIITLDEVEAAEFGGETGAAMLVDVPPVQDGWGRALNWEDWRPQEKQYHAALWSEYWQWRVDQTQARERADWLEVLRSSMAARESLPVGAFQEMFR